MRVTDAMAAAHWEELRSRSVLHVHAWKDSAKNALKAVLADVPDPYELTSQLVCADRRIAALEAQLAAARVEVARRTRITGFADERMLAILDGKEPA